jgi:hypothetical protein
MADSSVPITAGSGTPIDTRTASNGDNRQVVVLGNDGDAVGAVEQWGAQVVNMGPSTLFYDSWSVSPIDTTDKWTVVGTAPTIATGTMTMPATVSTYNAIRTKDAVRAHAGFTYVANGITVETTTTTGAGRFWGLGTPATTPAAAVLAQDGVGFELDQATGALLAVTYAAGVRTTRPTDGGHHRYAMHFRVTQAYWYIDNLGVPVASMAFPPVQVVELPALIVRQNAASFTGTPVFVNTAHLTGDTSRMAQSVSDPVVGTRMARVSPNGALSVATQAQQTTGVASGNVFVARAAITAATTSVLQVAPATGLSLYVTDVSVSNSGGTLSTVSLLPTAGTAVLDIVAAASGGGGSMNFQTPIKLAAATGLSVATSAASTTVYVTVTGYTAP